RSRINLHEMIELFKQNEASGLSFFSGQKNSEYYIRYAPGDFADAETDLINITTPMFINFADFFIEMSSTELTGSMHENMLDSNFEREKEKSGLYMFNRTSYAEWYYILPSSAPEPGFAGMVPLADSGGRILLDKQTYSMRFSVCAESKNQEAAWELIKFFASPAFYEDEKRIMTSDAYEYWFYSRDCYMPVYKPALKTKIISALKNVTGQFVYISFAFDTKITDADHADFMMDFYERLFQYEFVYRAEDWQSLAMFDAYAYYLSHTKNYRESDVPFSDVAEQVQRSYEKLMQNDPEHFWIEEQLTGENQPGGSYTFKRYIILLIELQKMFIRYGFPE
ncbi:MAG: hypothetical protein FWE82_01020, partial [Defluviitaleaceae bacterium]|nr:hypothetical protein [Defluviitaleaceae bacterium]